MSRPIPAAEPAEEAEAIERGVSAVLVALLLVPMIGFVALGLDISRLNDERQDLWNSVDAAVLAGSSFLPDADAARSAAADYASRNMPGASPEFEFFCIVADDGTGAPDSFQIPSVCDPGPGPYTPAAYPGMACDGEVCALPCNPDPPEGDVCNTMQVSAESTVDYLFAPVIGFDTGDTGVASMAACTGACGTPIEGPADIVLVVDRTGSMRDVDIAALQYASLAFLEGLTPSLQSVGLVALGRTDTAPSPSCPTEPSSSRIAGPWVAVGLRDDYDSTDNDPPDDPPDLNPVSPLVVGIECLAKSRTGTNLGDPIAAAGAHLLSAGRPDVPKGIVFMTDGEANGPNGSGSCDYALDQAQNVKNAGIVVVTIAYRLEGVQCGGRPATEVLADMASDPAEGPLTADDGGDGPGGNPGGCGGGSAGDDDDDDASATVSSGTGTAEHGDGDHFFCAPDPADLLPVFDAASKTVLAAFEAQTRLVRLPGS
jgi:hypothetical protein